MLEKAEELELPAEVIGPILTSLRLLGNANSHNTAARRNSLLMQMNPRLKELLRDKDFEESAPMLFGENFDSLAKERLEAAAALTKTLSMDKPQSVFHKNYSQKQKGRGGGSRITAAITSRRDGNPATAKLPRNCHQKMTSQVHNLSIIH